MPTVREIEEMLANNFRKSTQCLRAYNIQVLLDGYRNETLEMRLAGLFGNNPANIRKYLSGVSKNATFDLKCANAMDLIVTFQGQMCPPLMYKLCQSFGNNPRQFRDYLKSTGDID